MSDFDDRLARLQEAYPDAVYSALFHLPQGFDQDSKKVRAFIRTWAAAEDLASMLASRIERLAEGYREPFPGMAGPGFEELGRKHAGAFLQKVQKAAAVDGTVSNEFLYGAFGDVLERVRKLEKDVKQAHLSSEIESLSQGRRGRSR